MECRREVEEGKEQVFTMVRRKKGENIHFNSVQFGSSGKRQSTAEGEKVMFPIRHKMWLVNGVGMADNERDIPLDWLDVIPSTHLAPAPAQAPESQASAEDRASGMNCPRANSRRPNRYPPGSTRSQGDNPRHQGGPREALASKRYRSRRARKHNSTFIYPSSTTLKHTGHLFQQPDSIHTHTHAHTPTKGVHNVSALKTPTDNHQSGRTDGSTIITTA